MTTTISLIIALASIVIAIYNHWKYRLQKGISEKINERYKFHYEELLKDAQSSETKKQLKKVTEYKDVLWITNQELGKQLRESKNEAVHFKKLYVDTWHQNQSLLDMRSENLSFLITVKPNNIKRKRPSTKTSS